MDEAKLNGSGVVDPTAYTAIRRTEGSNEVYPGDIWRTENSQGKKLTVLVIAVSGTICIGLNLQEDGDFDNRVSVTVNGREMATNCAMLSFRFNNLLTEMVGTITEPRLKRILKRVGEVLGIDPDEDLREEVKRLREANTGSCESFECRRDMRQEQIDRLRLQFEIEKREAEIATLQRRIENMEGRIIEYELQRLQGEA